MDALLVVDMQVGLLDGAPKHDLAGVVERINLLSANVRKNAGAVIFIQHAGEPGDPFEPGAPGWALLPELHRTPDDPVVSKSLNDPFHQTQLEAVLLPLAPARLLISGWATDFCVDATVRSAVSRSFEVVVASDCHTLSDRPHLTAAAVITHHHWVWANLISRRPLRIVAAADLIR